MTIYGWVIFLFSNVLVLSLVVTCFILVFRSGEHIKDMHAPLDIDTHDTEDSAYKNDKLHYHDDDHP